MWNVGDKRSGPAEVRDPFSGSEFVFIDARRNFSFAVVELIEREFLAPFRALIRGPGSQRRQPGTGKICVRAGRGLMLMSVQEQMGAGFLRQDRLDVEPIRRVSGNPAGDAPRRSRGPLHLKPDPARR